MINNMNTLKAGRILTRSGKFFKVLSINSLDNNRIVFLQNMETKTHMIKMVDEIKDNEVLNEDPVTKEFRYYIMEGLAKGYFTFAKYTVFGFITVNGGCYLFDKYMIKDKD